MTQQVIGIGSAPNDGTGDTLRDAFGKANDNFTELYATAVAVADRTALLATTGDSVLVRDAAFGGVFLRSTDQVSGELVGLRIRRSDNSYVERVWNGSHYLFDWCDISAFDDPATALKVVIDMLDGSAKIVGRKNTVYEFSKACSVSAKSFHLSGLHIKRADAKVATTTASTANGASSVTVDDSSAFAVGDLIFIADGKSTNNISGIPTLAQSRQISSIPNSTTINISGTFNRTIGTAAWPIGSKVFTAHSLIAVTSGGESKRHTVENCVFDGNEANNRETYAWNISTTLSGISQQWEIRNCYSHDVPSENFVLQGGVVVDNCIGKNLWGAMVHLSAPSTVSPSTAFITNCAIDGVCKIADEITLGTLDHNEGAITWSSNVSRVKIANCTFKNGAQGCFGAVGNDDQQVEVTDCAFETFDYITYLLSGAATGTVASLYLSGCEFLNCGDMFLTGNDVRQAFTFPRSRITDCIFIGNTRLWAKDMTDFELTDCRFVYSDSPTWSNTLLATDGNFFPEEAAIQFARCDRITVRDVYIESPKTYDEKLKYGLLCSPWVAGGPKRKDSGGTDTDYFYPQCMDFSRITIANFRNGFCHDNILTRTIADTVEGWRCSEITVYGPPNTTHTPDGTQAVAIHLAPGVVAKDLLVYSMHSTNTAFHPLIAAGIHNNVAYPEEGQRGATVNGYILLGPCNRGLTIGTTVTGRSAANVVVVNALLSNTTISNEDTTNYVEFTDIGSANLSTLTAEVAQNHYRSFENDTAY